MSRPTLCLSACLALSTLVFAQQEQPVTTKPAPTKPATPQPVPAAAIPAASEPSQKAGAPLYGFDALRMDGKAIKLADYSGKVLLLVNTASRCGLTPQYEGLEKLQQTYGAKGFTVLAFPANDFGKQEPGTNAEIANFCKDKFAITFPVFQKISVKGDDQAPLYKWLTTASPFPGDVQWNFQKYLVDRGGQVVARFDPRVPPEDAKVTTAIEAALAQPARRAAPSDAPASGARDQKSESPPKPAGAAASGKRKNGP